MIRRILLILILGSSLFCTNVRCEQEQKNEVQLLLQQIDLVFFVLQRNTLRMERYGLHELESEINNVPKEISAKHCKFKINLASPGFCAHSLSWDEDDLSRLKIVSGKRRAPEICYLLLSKIFSPEVDLDDVSLIFFDCQIDHPEILKGSGSIRKADKRSILSIVIPFGKEELCSKFVFDGTVKAACGFFVQHDLFEHGLSLYGKMKRDDAFEKGFLIAEDTQEILDEEHQEVGGESFAAAKLAAVRKFFGTLWNKISGFFG